MTETYNQKSRFMREALKFCEEIKVHFENTVSVLEVDAKERGKDATIQVQWLPNSEFEAFAEIIESLPGDYNNEIQGGIYRISITDGMLIKLIYSYEIILTIMSRTKARNSIGKTSLFIKNAQNNSSSEYAYKPNYFNIDLLSSLINLDVGEFDLETTAMSIERSFWPFELNDRYIDESTRHFVLFAVNFLALHEGSHIMRGHLDYLQDKLGLQTILESQSYSDAPNDVQMRHSMEMDADQQAFINLIGNYLNSQDNIEAFSDVFTMSLTILFSLFDMTIRPIDAYKSKSHPDPDVRIFAGVSYASTVHAHLSGEKEKSMAFQKTVLDALKDSAIATIRAFQEVGVLGGGPQRLVAEMSGDSEIGLQSTVKDLYGAAVNAQNFWAHRVPSSFNPKDLGF